MNLPSRNIILPLLLLFALVWFGTLDHRRLINPDEGRYAEIAREMATSGDWITPRLNGFKYFEKPALQYWTTATAYTLFGEHHWTARLWSALTGFAGILFTGFAAARLFGPVAGLAAAAVLAGSLLWNLIGHLNTLDMGVSFFLSAGIFALCLAEREDATLQESRRWRDGAWALLAFAVLSKGLIGLVLPAAAVVAYVFWQRDWDLLRRIRPLRGALILLALTAPWFVAVSLANPEFPRFFFYHEHFERFLTKVHGRYEPAWYFFYILLVGMLPWLGSLLPGLRRGFRSDPVRRFQPTRFLLIWSILVFTFFSASSSKLASYILPIFPALAVLIGLAMVETPARRLRWHFVAMALLGTIALALVPLVTKFASAETPVEIYRAYQPWLYAAAILLIVGGAGGFLLARKGNVIAPVLLLGFAGHVSGQALLLGHDHFGATNSAYAAAAAIRNQLQPDEPFFSVNTYDQSLQFYLQRTTTLVAYRGELDFGIRQEPQKYLPSIEAFETAWLAAPAAWAIFSAEGWAQFKNQGLPMTPVYQDRRRVIVKKP